MANKLIMLLFVFVVLISIAYAITNGCGNEVDINTACVVRTPPITCSTYNLYNSTNNITIVDGSMEEIIAGTGVYNFTFLPNASGIHTIVLCDNTSSQINVETTDETDLGTILSNQATLQNNIETVNQTIKDQAAALNTSIRLNISAEADKIIENLSNDLGFFNPLLQIFNLSIIDHIRNNITSAVTDIVSRGDSAWIAATGFQTETNALVRFTSLSKGIQNNMTALNLSILTNITISAFSTTLSSADVASIGIEAASQILRQNLTIRYGYNRTSFAIVNATFNYTGIGIFLNESYNYDNESYLVNVTRRNHLD